MLGSRTFTFSPHPLTECGGNALKFGDCDFQSLFHESTQGGLSITYNYAHVAIAPSVSSAVIMDSGTLDRHVK